MFGLMKINRKQLLFVLLTFCLVIAFLEFALTLAATVSPKITQLLLSPGASIHVLRTVPDDRLGYRPNPDFPGHDSKGFRNPSIPDETSIVALGDSQTYGPGVEAQDAWPRQLAFLTGNTVYSMAYGGYGPVHSLVLWEEAVSLSPDILIEAFYAGNDLFDAFNLVYNQQQFPELRTTSADVQASIRQADALEPIAQRVTRIGNRTKIGSEVFFVREFLARQSKFYGLLRRARYELMRSAQSWENAKAWAKANPSYYQVFEDDQFRTIFTSEYRLSALDLQDSRIVEGHRISLEAIRRMHSLAARDDKRFLVVLIPTKELVFQPLVHSPSLSYRTLVQNEVQIWNTTKEFLDRHGIEYVDVLPGLREQLSAGIQPYQESRDGHPNQHGHRVIAKLIHTRLQKPQAAAHKAE